MNEETRYVLNDSDNGCRHRSVLGGREGKQTESSNTASRHVSLVRIFLLGKAQTM